MVRIAIGGLDRSLLGIVPVVDAVNASTDEVTNVIVESVMIPFPGAESNVDNAVVIDNDRGVAGTEDGVGGDGARVGFPVATVDGVLPNVGSGPGHTIVGGFVHHQVALETV